MCFVWQSPSNSLFVAVTDYTTILFWFYASQLLQISTKTEGWSKGKYTLGTSSSPNRRVWASLVQRADLKYRETNHWTQKLWTGEFLWSSRWTRSSVDTPLPSLTACIMNVCTSCFKAHWSLPHFAVIHESFTVHISHCRWISAAWHPSAQRIKLQQALHIWREILLFQACLRAHYELKTDKCDVTRSTGILETLGNTSGQNFMWFALWFSFRDRSDLRKKKNT